MAFITKQSVAFNILNNIQEDSTADILEKGINHKYYKREGVPGNYKYYYTEAEYREAKGTSKESDSKLKHNIVDDINNGEIINSLFKEWDSIKTTEQHEKWAKKVANTKFGTYKEKTILNVIDNFNPKFRNEIVKNDFLNEVKRAYDSYEEKTVESTKEDESLKEDRDSHYAKARENGSSSQEKRKGIRELESEVPGYLNMKESKAYYKAKENLDEWHKEKITQQNKSGYDTAQREAAQAATKYIAALKEASKK